MGGFKDVTCFHLEVDGAVGKWDGGVRGADPRVRKVVHVAEPARFRAHPPKVEASAEVVGRVAAADANLVASAPAKVEAVRLTCIEQRRVIVCGRAAL